MTMAELFKESRKSTGKTQEQFAECTNFSPRTICRFENGQNMDQYTKYFCLFRELGWIDENKMKGQKKNNDQNSSY